MKAHPSVALLLALGMGAFAPALAPAAGPSAPAAVSATVGTQPPPAFAGGHSGDLELPDPDMLQGLLALSPGQKDKLEVIVRAGRAQQVEHLRKLQALVNRLAQQLRQKARDSALAGTLDLLKAERLAQQSDQDAAMDQALAVLSPTQAALYVIYLRDQRVKAALRRWKAAQKK